MKTDNSIFVSIASYRDPVCVDTLRDMYMKANNPMKVFTGICQQNKNNSDSSEDQDCLDKCKMSQNYKKNVRIIRIPYTEAKGPTFARYLCSTLYNNENYFLQIDSHTKFVKDWDIKLINMIRELKIKNISKKPILSHYTHNIDQVDTIDSHNVPVICKSFFHESNGIISFEGAQAINTNGKFRRSAYITGGMFFCEGYFLNEVPFDPNLNYLFIGEEILHSVRFYTHGWDIFTPKENIVFHEYTRSDKPKIWTDKTYTANDAETQVKKILGIIKNNSNDSDLYGLGSIRTLEDYYSFTGIDINNKTISKNFCTDEMIIEKFGNSNDNTEHLTIKGNPNPLSTHIYVILFIIIILITLFYGK